MSSMSHLELIYLDPLEIKSADLQPIRLQNLGLKSQK